MVLKFTLSIIITLSLAAPFGQSWANSLTEDGQPKGKFLCWDANAPEGGIPGYGSDLNKSNLDHNGNRSFVLDFSKGENYWGWSFDGDLIEYSWSESECEDSYSISFNSEDFYDVLEGNQDHLYGEYQLDIPEQSFELTLKCENFNLKEHDRPSYVLP